NRAIPDRVGPLSAKDATRVRLSGCAAQGRAADEGSRVPERTVTTFPGGRTAASDRRTRVRCPRQAAPAAPASGGVLRLAGQFEGRGGAARAGGQGGGGGL